MDLAFVLVTLRRAWWLLLLTGLLGLAGATVVNATSPVQYTATVQQFVSMTDQVQASSGTSGALSGSQFALQRVKSYTQIATSSQVLQPVIDRLRLPTTVGGLAGRVTAENPLDTVLITLSVTDEDPQRAADTANAISVQLGTVVQDIEAPAGGGVSPVKVTVTERAAVPTAPVSPKVTLNLALGLLVGLGLGSGAALLRAQLDTRVTRSRDVETLTGRATLGVVPFDPGSKAQPLVPADQTSPRAEAYRTLRTNLRFADIDNPPRAIVITSALSGEGKSTTAGNIALTLAVNGSRVVLVEADLRKPRACSYLGLDSVVGLTDVLVGHYALADVLVDYQGGLLTVLPAGPIPPNPSELLGSQQLSGLIRTLSDDFDYVIIDTAPLLPVTDAAVLAAGADGVLVVVQHSKITRDELHQAMQALDAAKARTLGTVINCAPLSRRRRGKGTGYIYGYGYQYAYGGRGARSTAMAPLPEPTANEAALPPAPLPKPAPVTPPVQQPAPAAGPVPVPHREPSPVPGGSGGVPVAVPGGVLLPPGTTGLQENEPEHSHQPERRRQPGRERSSMRGRSRSHVEHAEHDEHDEVGIEATAPPDPYPVSPYDAGTPAAPYEPASPVADPTGPRQAETDIWDQVVTSRAQQRVAPLTPGGSPDDGLPPFLLGGGSTLLPVEPDGTGAGAEPDRSEADSARNGRPTRRRR